MLAKSRLECLQSKNKVANQSLYTRALSPEVCTLFDAELRGPVICIAQLLSLSKTWPIFSRHHGNNDELVPKLALTNGQPSMRQPRSSSAMFLGPHSLKKQRSTYSRYFIAQW